MIRPDLVELNGTPLLVVESDPAYREETVVPINGEPLQGRLFELRLNMNLMQSVIARVVEEGDKVTFEKVSSGNVKIQYKVPMVEVIRGRSEFYVFEDITDQLEPQGPEFSDTYAKRLASFGRTQEDINRMESLVRARDIHFQMIENRRAARQS